MWKVVLMFAQAKVKTFVEKYPFNGTVEIKIIFPFDANTLLKNTSKWRLKRPKLTKSTSLFLLLPWPASLCLWSSAPAWSCTLSVRTWIHFWQSKRFLNKQRRRWFRIPALCFSQGRHHILRLKYIESIWGCDIDDKFVGHRKWRNWRRQAVAHILDHLHSF